MRKGQHVPRDDSEEPSCHYLCRASLRGRQNGCQAVSGSKSVFKLAAYSGYAYRTLSGHPSSDPHKGRYMVARLSVEDRTKVRFITPQWEHNVGRDSPFDLNHESTMPAILSLRPRGKSRTLCLCCRSPTRPDQEPRHLRRLLHGHRKRATRE